MTQNPVERGFWLGHIAQLDALLPWGAGGERAPFHHARQQRSALRGSDTAVPDVIGAHDRLLASGPTRGFRPRQSPTVRLLTAATGRSKAFGAGLSACLACPSRDPIC